MNMLICLLKGPGGKGAGATARVNNLNRSGNLPTTSNSGSAKLLKNLEYISDRHDFVLKMQVHCCGHYSSPFSVWKNHGKFRCHSLKGVCCCKVHAAHAEFQMLLKSCLELTRQSQKWCCKVHRLLAIRFPLLKLTMHVTWAPQLLNHSS